MSRRNDYLDDPDAPAPNSLVPSVNAVVSDEQGRILLIRRTDNGNWSLPGGAMDLGETMADAAIRETKEETGIDCEITGLVGIYTNPRHVVEYTSNGEVRQECTFTFKGEPTGGTPTPSSESSEVHWVPPEEISGLTMHTSMRLRIGHFLEHRAEPYLG